MATFSGMVTNSLVISSETGWASLSAKRTSRLVRMPTNLPVASTTGMPEMRWVSMRPSASLKLALGSMVTGFTTMPDSNFFTFSTSAACCSGVKLRCTTPMPPAWAIAMAILPSVTVSIADDKIGMLRLMVFVSLVAVSTSPGITSEGPGRSKTSSNVRERGKFKRSEPDFGSVVISTILVASSDAERINVPALLACCFQVEKCSKWNKFISGEFIHHVP